MFHLSAPEGPRVIRAEAGSRVGDLEVREIVTVDLTGLEAVSDPGSLPVFASFIPILLGLVMTFYRKIRDGV